VPPDFEIHRAELRDLAEIVSVEQAAWPEALRAEERNLACRIERGLLHVARGGGGRISGFLTAFRPSWIAAGVLSQLLSDFPAEMIAQESGSRWRALVNRYHLARDWHEATADGSIGELHHPNGDVLFGVGITTDPNMRGRGVAKALLRGAFREAARTGVRYFAGYGRLPLFHRYDVTLDEYLVLLEQRAPLDIGFKLHRSVGARPVRTGCGRSRYVGIPHSMRDDPESRGCGFLVITPL
jgi:GNAT superfamily N-acetyltransferase